MIKNKYVVIPDYGTNSLNETINIANNDGYFLVSVVMAKNKYGCECMYLFFGKEIQEEEDGVKK